jgi:hypothetical protein
MFSKQLQDRRIEFLWIVVVPRFTDDIETLAGNRLDQNAAQSILKRGKRRLKDLAVAGRNGVGDGERLRESYATEKSPG